MRLRILPSTLDGKLTLPGSKSHTLRAVVLSTLAKGRSVIYNPLETGDGWSALSAAIAFGAKVELQTGSWTIDGTGGRPSVPANVIDTGNSGTATNFFASVAALADGYTVLTGDEQIRRRSIAPLVQALNQLGARAYCTTEGRSAPPVIIHGTLKGGEVSLLGHNSQFVSSLLLSTPLIAENTTLTVIEGLETPYIQMTLDWMERYHVNIAHREEYERFVIEGGQQYIAGEHTIAADWSSAAFPLVGAAITDSHLILSGLDFDDNQGDRRIIEILKQYGAALTVDRLRGEVTVRGGTPLKADHTIDLSDTPDMLPALAVLATQAEGRTRFINLAHVREKETDRVAQMEEKLSSLGCSVFSEGDELIIDGPTPIRGATVSSSGDHRIAMALAAAGLASTSGIEVTDAQCIAVSFPAFARTLQELGASIETID